MKLTYSTKPQAKMDNLVVQDLSNEVLIYNLENNKAYSLNETTTLVWQNCDGTKDVGEIAKSIEKQLDQNIPDELVWLALDNLKKENLVSFDDAGVFSGLSRRDVIKRVGLATMAALPIIVAVSAPTAANAQSGNIGACLGCITDIGVGNTSQCPPDALCEMLTCQCWGNNSCMGIGQQVPAGGSCASCASVDDGMGSISTAQNSFRCV